MAKKKIPTERPFFQDISVAEVNLALETRLKEQVFTKDLFGKKRPVPVFFRDRDSKIIPDASPGGMVLISWDSVDRAEGVYQSNCDYQQVVRKDKDGNPLAYRIISAPDAIWLSYTITARATEWDDIIAIHDRLSKIFPLNHTNLDVKGAQVRMLRDGFTSADDEELGIFIREINIRILGYIWGLDTEDDRKIVNAIKNVELTFCPTSDPKETEVDCDTVTLFDDC